MSVIRALVKIYTRYMRLEVKNMRSSTLALWLSPNATMLSQLDLMMTTETRAAHDAFAKISFDHFKIVFANIYLSLSKYFARLHNCQFEFTLVSLCFPLSLCVHIMWRGRCWRDGMSMFALAEKKSYEAKQFFEVTFLLQNQTCIKLKNYKSKLGDRPSVINQNITISNLETVTGQKCFVWK